MTSDLITPLGAADSSHGGLQVDLRDSQAVFRMRSGPTSALQDHPQNPLMCTHLEMDHSAHCALCTWQGGTPHTVCSHLHFALRGQAGSATGVLQIAGRLKSREDD